MRRAPAVPEQPIEEAPLAYVLPDAFPGYVRVKIVSKAPPDALRLKAAPLAYRFKEPPPQLPEGWWEHQVPAGWEERPLTAQPPKKARTMDPPPGDLSPINIS